MQEDTDPHHFVAGYSQQRIFDTYSHVLKNAAYEAIHMHGVPIPELVIFCVDEASRWFDIFAPSLGDPEPQKKLQADEIFVFHGASYISNLSKLLNRAKANLGDGLKTPCRNPDLVKCLIMDTEGVSLFHIEPVPTLLN